MMGVFRVWFSLAIVQADFQYLRCLNAKEIRDARCLFAKITAETFGPTSGSGAAAEPLPYFESGYLSYLSYSVMLLEENCALLVDLSGAAKH